MTCTPRGNAYSRGSLAVVRHDDQLALPFDDAAVLHHAVDLRDYSGILRLARLEELDDARQTAGDVLRLRRLARDLGEDVAGFDRLAVLHHEVRMHRHVVLADGLAALVLHLDRRLLLLVRRVDDDESGQTGDFVHLFVNRQPFDDVLEADGPGLLRENREGIRIPFDDRLSLLDLLAVAHLESRAIHDRIALAIAALLVGHDERAVPVHDDELPTAFGGLVRLDDLQVLISDRARMLRIERVLLRHA